MDAMLTPFDLFAVTALQARETHPLSAFLAGTIVLIATDAFIIPKPIAIWSIRQVVTASATVPANAAVAEQLFQLPNPPLSCSLFTSFDVLGF
jgi:hypothetical protein